MTFAQVFRELGTKQVTVVRHEGALAETRFDVEAHIQSKSGFFAVSVPIYEGAVVELPDPRGGTARRLVVEVSVNDFGPDDMHHIKAVWGQVRPARIAQVRWLSFEGLHPEVVRAPSDLFADGHFSSANGEAFKSLVSQATRCLFAVRPVTVHVPFA